MEYILGQSYLLPVREVITENKRKFYKVEANGKEYNILLFDFQKDDEKPEEVACIVKGIHNGEPMFVQDTKPLLLRLYKEKVVYPFWVKADCTNLPSPYYEISDLYNFTFKLPAMGADKLSLHQRIECRVKEIVEGKIFFELIKKEARTSSLPFLTIDELLLESDTEQRIINWFKKLFQKNKALKDIRDLYDAGNEEWVIMAIEYFDNTMDSWVTSRRNGNSYLLDKFRRVCIYLLEDSDILLSCSETERDRYQRMLSNAAQHADVFLEAIDLVKRNEHTRQTDILLTKIKKSGFLYNPDRRLKVLMCLFALDKNLMESKVLIIFNIIIKGNKDNWMREPFRSAFISMLELFINQNRSRIDRLAAITSDKEFADLKKLVAALAIQLLLMNEKDEIDRQLIRAMFYRYLTYVQGSKSNVLFEKAFRCLTEAEQSKLEYSWNEISDLTMLAIRTSSILSQSGEKSTFMQSYNSKHSKLQVFEGKIELHPIETGRRQNPLLPDNLLPWHSIQIYGDGNISPLKAKEIQLSAYQKFWREIEYTTINGTETVLPKTKNKKLRPEAGDEVVIRVKHQDLDNPSHFIFEIEDETYCGEGTLSVRNIVRYNMMVDERAFCDTAGRPYLLKAKVLSTDLEGNLNFTITDMMNNYVRDMISVGEEVTCLVTDVNCVNCLCISEYGYSLQLPLSAEMEGLEPGNYIKVEIENIRSTGTIEGTYLFRTMDNFTVNEAFESLILNYAEEKVYEVISAKEASDVDEQQQEVLMDYEYVVELINIIDRMAVLETDYIRTYNYLAFARLLSLLVKDMDSSAYYNERMRLLQMLQHFAINGSVEQKKLEELTSNYGIMLNNYPMLQGKFYELQLMACMDWPERNDKVWELMTKTKDDHLNKLCNLVLAYNTLKGFGMHTERESIRKKINEELNILVEGDEPEYFGDENQQREFKTSTVYPASNNMRVDVKAQTHELLEVICGFLNADGGTLYLGVNNEGVAAGLESDLEFFNGKDKLDLHIRNNIVQKFGNYANSMIKVRTSENNGKFVYAMDVLPSAKPVELDGICYQRQGTSTWPLLGDDLELFKAGREEEVDRLLAKKGSEVSASAPQENVDTIHVTTTDTAVQQTPVPDTRQVKSEISKITTSALRDNPLHSWEDNFGVDTVCFLHLLPNGEYLITKDEYWEETDLTLCIRNEDEYLVIVYENGNMIKVPISQLVDKKERTSYKRNTSRVFFACPAKSSSMIYSEVVGIHGGNYIRLDDVTRIKEGKITDAGERLSLVDNDGVVKCEILPSGDHSALRKIYNLKPTQLGHLSDTKWCSEAYEYIQKLINK